MMIQWYLIRQLVPLSDWLFVVLGREMLRMQDPEEGGC